MKLKDIKIGTILWLLAIGSCSVGAGLTGNPGDGFMIFGIGVGLYALFRYM